MMKRCFLSLSVALIVLSFAGMTSYAQRPDAPPFALRGDFAVGTRDYSISIDEDQESMLTVWYPAELAAEDEEETVYRLGPVLQAQGNAARDAAPDLSGAPYPAVIFSHGNGGFRFQSLFLIEHLASHGFIVFALDHPGNTVLDMLSSDEFVSNRARSYGSRPLDILYLIDYANTLTASDGDFTGMIDVDNVAVAGHSFGGYTALAASGAQLNLTQLGTLCTDGSLSEEFRGSVCFLTEEASLIAEGRGLEQLPEAEWPVTTDPRIRATVALAPWNGPILDLDSLSEIDIPALFIVGGQDSVTPPERDTYFIYDHMLSAPRSLITLEHGDHFLFVDACSDLALRLGFFTQCSDPVWDMSRAHDLVNHFTTAFLLASLYDDADAAGALRPEAVDFRGVTFETENPPQQEAVTQLIPQVLNVYPHDTDAFTQGLLLYNNLFYESTGRYGQSDVREVDPFTGEVLRRVDLDAAYFGEGLERVDDRLIQITWREETAFIYDLATFDQIGTFSYEGEGWGLCYDGEYLFMSDGTPTIMRRDPVTFSPLESIPVTLEGEPIHNINELECVGDDIYANIWLTDMIVRINKHSGIVNAVINADNLLTEEQYAELTGNAVLNGIAHDPENDTFFITGKLWPSMFEVRFVPAN